MSNLTALIKSSSDYCSLQPSGIAEIHKAEEQLGLCFAPDYKEYLLAFGAASFDGRELTGICQSDRLNVVAATERARRFYQNFPKDIYVIEDLGFDHVLIAQDAKGRIYTYGPTDYGKVISNSMQEYFFPNIEVDSQE